MKGQMEFRIGMNALLLLFSVGGFAQTESALEQADAYYNVGKYREALKAYSALEQKAAHEHERIANCHYYLHEYLNAEATLSKLMDVKEIVPSTVLHYAEVLIAQKKYMEASVILEKYAATKDALNVDHLLQTCEWAPQHQANRPEFQLHGTNIETGGKSLGLAVTNEGVFYGIPQESKEENLTVYYDLVFAKMNDSISFSAPQPLNKEMNTKYYEGSPSVSPDGKFLYFSRNASTKDEVNVKKKAKNNISEEGVNVLKIMQAQKVNGEWTNITELPINNIQYSSTHPSLSADGKTMYFVSNMPGGQGGYDVYSMTQGGAAGVWSKPLNLGPKVNTKGNEMFPHFFNGTLYFATNGGVGFGGYDIFRSVKSDGGFAQAENVGPGLNSSKDDFAAVFNADGASGYVSSDREGENGGDQIFNFKKIYYPFMVEGIVLDKVTTKAIESAKVTVKYKDGNVWTEKLSDAKGNLSFELYPHYDYAITFAKDGYESQTFDVPAGTPKDSIIAMLGNVEMGIEVKKDVVINLDNIYFALAQAEPLPESLPILDRLVNLMNEHPEARIELSAHTDCRGSNEYNRELSDRRANACSDYLAQKGINTSRTVPKGYGETKPLNECVDGVVCDEDQYQKNRRVEIKIL
ncbi:MAG: OmpA family protein [Flavobacteriales bacterium]|nr:OmpA family protein [Flavobacteriales bacterium]